MVTMDQDQALRRYIDDYDKVLRQTVDSRDRAVLLIAQRDAIIVSTKPRVDYQKNRVVYWQEQTYLAEDRLQDARFRIADLERELNENHQTA